MPSFRKFLLIITTSPVVAFNNSLHLSSSSIERQHCFGRSKLNLCKMNKNDDDNNEDSYNPRDNFARELRGFQASAFKDKIEVGDMVVCALSNPDLGIYENVSYELKSIYAQSFDDETQSVVKLQLNALDDPIPAGSTLYVMLFSPNIHKEAVVVSPQEVGLSSVRNELGNAALLAVPGFFWVLVASSFYSTYHERTGGSFLDAFWGK